MNVLPNPHYDAVLKKLSALKPPCVKWEGLLFRASPLPFSQAVRLLDGWGSFIHGSRWAAAESNRAVNLSTSPTTALQESAAGFTYYNFAASDVRPKVIVAVKAKFHRLLDLTSARIREERWLGLERAILEDWRGINDLGRESLSQAIGRAAHDLGAEAVLVPSAKIAGQTNLVYFPESLLAQSRVEILGEEELNQWIKNG